MSDRDQKLEVLPATPAETFPSAEYFHAIQSAELDGSCGTNRDFSDGNRNQLGVNSDIEAATVWLQLRAGKSLHTQRAYRREVFRLILWAISFPRKPLSSLDAQDIAAFQNWLLSPVMHPSWPNHWVLFKSMNEEQKQSPGKPGRKRARSVAYALTVCSTMFSYLKDNGYLKGNPFKAFSFTPLRNFDDVETTRGVSRYFESELWDWLVEFVENMPCKTERQKLSHERLRFVLHFGYWSAARRTELVRAWMSDISQTPKGNWAWHLLGKGNKEGFVVLELPAINALVRYRRARGLSPYPQSVEDNVPLVADLDGERQISDVMLNKTLVQFFRKAEKAAVGKVSEAQLAKLSKASSHWLRHSYGSHKALEGTSNTVVAHQLRHASTATTDRYYVHSEVDDRAERLNPTQNKSGK